MPRHQHPTGQVVRFQGWARSALRETTLLPSSHPCRPYSALPPADFQLMRMMLPRPHGPRVGEPALCQLKDKSRCNLNASVILPVKSFEEVTRASLVDIVDVQAAPLLLQRITQYHLASRLEKSRLPAGTRSQPCREPAANNPPLTVLQGRIGPPERAACIGKGCYCLRRPRCRRAPVAGHRSSS